jgi:type II secretory pathway predicted ATPase ExeA
MDLRSRFGFHTMPFTKEIENNQQLKLNFADEALAGVRRCVDLRLSAAIIAPAGSGKTALARRLVADLPEARYATTYVKVTSLSKRDMCREIARACGADTAGTYAALVDKLQVRFANTYGSDGRRPVIIMDEAHDLRPDVLGMLRILTNFEMDSRLVISLVLIGQPPLGKMLAREDQEAVAKRIAFYASLRLLSREETSRYVEHRCTIAGSVKMPFDDASLDAIYELSRGNMRAIDGLALQALFTAEREKHDVVDTRHVAAARKQLAP